MLTFAAGASERLTLLNWRLGTNSLSRLLLMVVIVSADHPRGKWLPKSSYMAAESWSTLTRKCSKMAAGVAKSA